MGKPAWVKVLGWVLVCELAAALALGLEGALGGGSEGKAALMVLLYVVSLPTAAAWVGGTLAHRSRVRRARIMAAAMRAPAPR